MNELTKLIKADMLPALGVTEPGAIAFSVAKARSYTKGELKHVNVAMNLRVEFRIPMKWAMCLLQHSAMWLEMQKKDWNRWRM